MEEPQNRDATLIELFSNKDLDDYRAFTVIVFEWREIDLTKFIEILPNLKFSESNLTIRLRAAPEESIGLEDKTIDELIKKVDLIYQQLGANKGEKELQSLTDSIRRGTIKIFDISSHAEKLAGFEEFKRKQDLRIGGIQR